MHLKIDEVVIPGDVFKESQLKTDKKQKIILGPGLRKVANQICVCNAGILRNKAPNVFWVDYYQKRYVPAKGESVIGVVIGKTVDVLKLDIGASEPASLSFLAFEGVSKKNKPDINIGDVVYGRLLAASSDVEPELVCVDSNLKQNRYGSMEGGFLFNCSTSLIYKLLNPKCSLIKLLSKDIKYEIILGMNGKVWVKAKTAEETLAIANCILNSEFLSYSAIKANCHEVMNCLRGMDTSMDTT